MFANFFGGSKMGGNNDMFGSGSGGGEAPEAYDLMMQGMAKMGLGQSGGQGEMQMPGGPGMRGGYASHTITRRHTGRDGRQTMDKQHRCVRPLFLASLLGERRSTARW